MVGLDHVSGQSAPEAEDKKQAARNARLGMVLFCAYSLLYGAFVLLNAFASPIMDNIVWQGVNVAVLYGFGLILAAILLAIVYLWLCRSRAIVDADNGSPRQA